MHPLVAASLDRIQSFVGKSVSFDQLDHRDVERLLTWPEFPLLDNGARWQVVERATETESGCLQLLQYLETDVAQNDRWKISSQLAGSLRSTQAPVSEHVARRVNEILLSEVQQQRYSPQFETGLLPLVLRSRDMDSTLRALLGSDYGTFAAQALGFSASPDNLKLLLDLSMSEPKSRLGIAARRAAERIRKRSTR
jgi:hypothetical protein